jgi:hypothetical protein
MWLVKNIQRRIIYRFTKKPECYVHIDKPKTWQEKRQVQYNNWCKAKGVYNGSYLPKNPDTLKRKGWNETTHPKNKTNKEYQRKSTGQTVRYDPPRQRPKSDVIEDEHYHWFKDKDKKLCRDKYGNECIEKKPQSHLAPFDKKYNYKK